MIDWFIQLIDHCMKLSLTSTFLFPFLPFSFNRFFLPPLHGRVSISDGTKKGKEEDKDLHFVTWTWDKCSEREKSVMKRKSAKLGRFSQMTALRWNLPAIWLTSIIKFQLVPLESASLQKDSINSIIGWILDEYWMSIESIHIPFTIKSLHEHY